MEDLISSILSSEDVMDALVEDQAQGETRILRELMQEVSLDNLVGGFLAEPNEKIDQMTVEAAQLGSSIENAFHDLRQIKRSVQFLSSNTIDITGSDDDDDVEVVGASIQPPSKTQEASKPAQLSLKHVPRHKRPEELPLPLAVGCKMYGLRPPSQWLKGTVIDILSKDQGLFKQKVRFKYDNHKSLRHLTMKELAYIHQPRINLPEGTRCIAFYKDFPSTMVEDSMYLGIVAEAPVERNKFRYLVFFDDGYAQYCSTDTVHQVYLQSHEVWHDVAIDSAAFIREYLNQYPDRPMVKLAYGQQIKTEWKGEWFTTRVASVDASLARLFFIKDRRFEWIYRGSTRLEPLYSTLCKAERAKKSGSTKMRRSLAYQNQPHVVYTRPSDSKSPVHDLLTTNRQVARKTTNTVRSTARKSGQAARTHRHNAFKERSTSYGGEGSCQVVTTPTVRGDRQGADASPVFKPHRCGPTCVQSVESSGSPDSYVEINPLLVPMFFGWQRELERKKKLTNSGRPHTYYRAPCGRRCRSEHEVDKYLQLTNSSLTIDLFSFDMGLHTHTEFIAADVKYKEADMTGGREPVPVMCVNTVDTQPPEAIEYSSVRIPTAGVDINTSPDFLICCDCTDDCRDAEKCACRKLTVEASAAAKGKINKDAGYHWRRLPEPIISGVYECNSKCSCSRRCHNRVVQLGLRVRLQVYKTQRKGWGVRCIDDIPAGGFICCYVGEVRTEANAEQEGKEVGDEYQAELDHIEVVEREKLEERIQSDEGISDEASEPEEEETDNDNDKDSSYAANVKIPADINRETRPRSVRVKLHRSASVDGESKCNRKSGKSVSASSAKGGGKKNTADSNDATQTATSQLVQSSQQTLDHVDSPLSNSSSAPSTDGSTQSKNDDSTQTKLDQIHDVIDVNAAGDGTKTLLPVVADQPTPTDVHIPQPKAVGDHSKSTSSSAEATTITYKVDSQSDLVKTSHAPATDSSAVKKPASEVIDSKPSPGFSGLKLKEETSEVKGTEEISGGVNKSGKSVLTVQSYYKPGEAVEMEVDEERQPTRRTELAAGARLEDSDSSDSDAETQGRADAQLLQAINSQVSGGSTEAVAEGATAPEEEPMTEGKLTIEKEPVAEGKPGAAHGSGLERDPMAEGDRVDNPVENPPQDVAGAEAGSEDEGIGDDGLGLQITDPTTLNVEDAGVEDESSRDSTANVPSGSSRFANLPDPKAQPNVEANEKTASGLCAPSGAAVREEKIGDFLNSFISTRTLFTKLTGTDEGPFIMDAKLKGNVGRYLNHSCQPNAFVQSVFVDTHDLRYPWVAFFASEHIRAGSELTWDYSYEVDSVPGKQLFCYCDAGENCRGRLL